jgi:hypothetical protein
MCDRQCAGAASGRSLMMLTLGGTESSARSDTASESELVEPWMRAKQRNNGYACGVDWCSRWLLAPKPSVRSVQRKDATGLKGSLP